MKKILRHIFYPLMIFGLLFFLLTFVESVADDYLVWVPIMTILPTVILIAFLERYMPFQKDWNMDRDDFVTDLLQTFITLPAASKFSEFLLPFLLYLPLSYFDGLNEGFLESKSNLFWSFVLSLLICEFSYYWMHRMTHRIPKLWSLHEVHHSAERVYWANSGRFHFFDAILGSAAYLLPLILLNTSDGLVVMVLVFSGITGFLEHVNIDFKAGYMNYVFNSAELHRWHHSAKEKESNHNFGKVLIVWDLLFGTFLWPKERTIKHVGVEGTDDPKGFLNQFFFPFR